MGEWHESELVVGSFRDDLIGNVSVSIPQSTQWNETHIYAHVCMARLSDDDNSKEGGGNLFHKTIPMTKHRLRKRIRDEKNLLGQDDERSINPHQEAVLSLPPNEQAKLSPLTRSSANTTVDAQLLYIKPSLSLEVVKGIPAFTSRNQIPVQISKHMQWYNDTSPQYYPLLYSSEFWISKASHVEVNDTLHETNIEITLNDVSMWKWQLTSQMEESWEKQEQMNGGEEGDFNIRLM